LPTPIRARSHLIAMCFFTIIDYTCGDWKWGNMRQQCPRQHRIGLTCGAKLPHPESSKLEDSACTICQHIATKHRRIAKARDAIQWRKNNGEHDFRTSILRAEKDIQELEKEIAELQSRRSSVINSRPSGSAGAAVQLPRMKLEPPENRHGSRDHRRPY
jgi:hypothetical protein